jgi:WD40 repeat protein
VPTLFYCAVVIVVAAPLQYAVAVLVAAPADDNIPLCAGNDGSLRIWSMAKGSCMLVVKQHSAEVTSAVWLPDGERIITGSHDKNMVQTPKTVASSAALQSARSLMAWKHTTAEACSSKLSEA